MRIDDKVKLLLDKVSSGAIDRFIPDLEGSDLGVFISVYDDGEQIQMMKPGYSQVERSLMVTVETSAQRVPEDNYIVGWMGTLEAGGHGGTQCRGAHNSCHRHCPPSSHGAGPKNCINHPQNTGTPEKKLIAPELKYEADVEQLEARRPVLNALAGEGFGLALLHGHNDEFMFTKLPEGYVSVVSNGQTSFRPQEEVDMDPTFVPNTWRCVNGSLQIAGGYSSI